MEEIDDEDYDSQNSANIYDDNYIIDKLPTDKNKLNSLLMEVKHKLRLYKNMFLK